MIHIERGEAPALFSSPQFAKLRKEAQAHFARPLKERSQGARFPLRLVPTLHGEAADALRAMFNGKCAYCESKVMRGEYDLYRPRGGVAADEGTYLADHYWAQAYEWTNHYLLCEICSRSKANRFPIEGTRAPADATGDILRDERPLLLDPCVDAPALHLVFTSDGRVAGLTPRGLSTIETLDLNRKQLIDDRRSHAKIVSAYPADARAKFLGDPSQPHLGMLRMLFGPLSPSATAKQARATPSIAKATNAKIAQQAYDAEREKVSTESGKGLDNFRARARFVERVRIKNIASIQSLDLDLTASTSTTAPCFAILGNNGVGKSTVLKCIALALAGRTAARETGVEPRHLLREGTKEGTVTINISGFKEPVTMKVTPRGITFSHKDSRALILGYGSTRLLPTGDHKSPIPSASAPVHAKIRNLFDPFLPLSDPNRWLYALDPDRFDDAARTMISLLPLEGKAHITVPDNLTAPAMVKLGSQKPHSLEHLSDGFQSMLALAVDILAVMYTVFESASGAQGIVLIDELGNHLHPAWRMRVVAALRTAFPQVQFIFSTHDPLCLRGLGNGEVTVLRRNARGRVQALTDLPDITGLRVDQLLTSEHFGLDSTVDPEFDAIIKRYYALSKMLKRTAAEQAEFDQLKQRLTETRLLGQSWRERLMLEVMDAEIANIPLPRGGTISITQQSEEAIKRMRTVLRKAGRGL